MLLVKDVFLGGCLGGLFLFLLGQLFVCEFYMCWSSPMHLHAGAKRVINHCLCVRACARVSLAFSGPFGDAARPDSLNGWHSLLMMPSAPHRVFSPHKLSVATRWQSHRCHLAGAWEDKCLWPTSARSTALHHKRWSSSAAAASQSWLFQLLQFC